MCGRRKKGASRKRGRGEGLVGAFFRLDDTLDNLDARSVFVERAFTRRSVATVAATYGRTDVFGMAPGSVDFFTTINLGGVVSDVVETIGTTTTDGSPCC